MARGIGALAICCVLAPLCALATESTQLPELIQFNRHVRPILSENCFTCHGPDPKARKAKLRLDTEEGARADLDGAFAVVPGSLFKSELYVRITSQDPDEVMPPPKSEHKLKPFEIAILKRWIEQGAKYEKHWSLIPPQRPELPKVQNAAWVRNPLDHFILARLEQRSIKPAAEADRYALIRRVTQDLTGLPPTIEETDAFLKDASPDAYEKLVERLLGSQHYGERMALEWLDAARFADTHGYHIDNGRDMTLWREWVIDAFNQNMPFDQFTVEQLAGDLLPNATPRQKVATGFHRNHMINFEGGAIAQEYLNAYLVDRVNTTGAVWLGLTVACAQCHDHKYDPITQKDYYQLYAFFNAVPEKGLDGSKGNAEPVLKFASAEYQAELDKLGNAIKELEQKQSGPLPEVDQAQTRWEQDAAKIAPVQWTVLDITEANSRGGAKTTVLPDKSVLLSGKNPNYDGITIGATAGLKVITAIRVEVLTDPSMASNGPGRSQNGNMVLSNVLLSAAASGKPGPAAAVKFKKASADFGQKEHPVTNAIDAFGDTGWAIFPEVGKPHYAVFEATTPLSFEGPVDLSVILEFKSSFVQHTAGRVRVSVTDSNEPHRASGLPSNIAAILALNADARSDEQKTALRQYYRSNHSDLIKKISEEIDANKKKLQELEKRIPNTMVMQDMPRPRDTFVMMRGQYDKPGEKVAANVPASLPPLPPGAPANRLGLAKWLVDPSHPLTARVIVNRYWQMYFGNGISKTSEDFGSQGESPTHPELLDWLATEFVKSGWDVRAMQRLIVTSATYRQASAVTPELLAKDPENRLHARGARHRLCAEFIRDQALAASGLLNRQIGGHSVSPYQPAGLWEELMSRADGAKWTAQTYVQSHGPDLYRRTMYTFWKRTSPPASLATFDAPDRETCTVRRARTNTPLQALVLMNDPTYVEAARKLAERMMREGGASSAERIAHGWRLALTRPPSSKQQGVLQKIYDAQITKFKQDGAAAQKLLKVGESPRDENLDAAELASWTIVATTILNLDATVTRE